MARNNPKSRSTKLMVKESLDKVHTVEDWKEIYPFEKSKHLTYSRSSLPDTSEDRCTSPEVIEQEVGNWTRSNDPMILDAPPIQLTMGDLGLSDDETMQPRFPLMEPDLNIRHFNYPKRSKKIVKWLKFYQLASCPADPYHDFHPQFNARSVPHPQRFPVGRMLSLIHI